MKFSKMHGLGNDFVVIDAINQSVQLNKAVIQKLSNRNTGIGFDQLLIIEPSSREQCDFYYRIYNANGSEVAQCGNGARVITKYIVENNLSNKKLLQVYTDASEMQLEYIDQDNIRVTIDAPKTTATALPMISDHEEGPFHLPVAEHSISFYAVNLGNPHIVISVVDSDKAPVPVLGEQLTGHHIFPEGVNVGFMQIINREEIKLRVYERGTGETQACGSGACAAVVAGILAGNLDHKVKVNLLGGQLDIEWQGDGQQILMQGPAVHVFDGEINL